MNRDEMPRRDKSGQFRSHKERQSSNCSPIMLRHRVKQMHLILRAPGGLPKYQCQLIRYICTPALRSGVHALRGLKSLPIHAQTPNSWLATVCSLGASPLRDPNRCRSSRHRRRRGRFLLEGRLRLPILRVKLTLAVLVRREWASWLRIFPLAQRTSTRDSPPPPKPLI